MKGDFSRVTYDPTRHYNRVLLQQGRVLLDADFNEQAAVSAHGLRRLGRDLLGPHAGPPDDKGHPGFYVEASGGKLSVAAGRYYVDGLLAETESAFELTSQQLGLTAGRKYVIYLDVWEQHVTWLEQDDLREPALGGPDTTTRVQTAWLVRADDRTDAPAGTTNWLDWLNQRHRRRERALKLDGLIWPQLHAWTDPQPSDDDTPCVADPAGGFRGLENQLYRVEIHTPGDPSKNILPTFKWSRENGSVAAAWVDVEGDNDLLVDGIHDSAHGFSADQWVELTSWEDEWAGRPGIMVRLAKVDGMRLTIDPASTTAAIPDPKKLDHPIVRRWDQREARNDKKGFLNGAVVLDEKREFYSLEAGIKIAFPPLKADEKGVVDYRTGDYWLIPARTAVGDILWPQDPALTGKERYASREPDGVEHVFAPLRLAEFTAAGTLTTTGASLQFKIEPPVKPV
jgi:hypothetical protein